MAEQLAQVAFEKKFKNIRLLHDHALGIGSYGKVCKAKCDDLLCAAKILHPILYDPTSQNTAIPMKEHRLPLQRFEQECKVMSMMRHPNVVQHLGLYQESCTTLPVLLMELMDTSLTHFLENAPWNIPFHIQVNLCHDIALALSYLHLNSIIHRDLSSNNVLLTLGNLRAKVSDFGMARLGDISAQMSRGTFTECPGTDAYMPPEAVQTNPVYTEKIDCFSFGVLAIQILSQQFPRPGDRHKFVEINDPQFPSGKIKACVSEVDRRQNHISVINSKHPLLPTALDCLKDEDVERPSAHELCERFEVLKSSSKYKEDVRAAKNRNESEASQRNRAESETVGDDEESATLQQERDLHKIIELQRTRLEEKDRHVSRLKRELQQALQIIQGIEKNGLKENELAESDMQLETGEPLTVHYLERKFEHRQPPCPILPDEPQTEEEGVQINRCSIERDMTRIQQDAHKVRDFKKVVQSQVERLREKDLTIEQRDHSIMQLESSIAIKDQIISQTNALNEQLLLAKDQEVQKLKQQLQECDNDEGQAVATKQSDVQVSYIAQQLKLSENTIIQFKRRIAELEEQLNLIDQYRAHSLQQFDTNCPKDQLHDTLPCLQLQWREGRRAPREMCRWSDAVVTDSTAYFRLLNTHKVYAYALKTKEWSRLPDCIYCNCPLAVINGLLTAIGGYYHGYFNQLISFTGKGAEKKWIEVLPPMPTKRSGSTALNSEKALIVAGGEGKYGKLTMVEIMNTKTFQWSSASPLIEPLYNASATLYGNILFILGGYDAEEVATRSVYACSLKDLLKSCRSVSLGKRIKKVFSSPDSTESVSMWNRIVDLPISDSTCVSIQSQLIAIGGKKTDQMPTTAIHMYNSKTNSWEVISHMTTSRYQCFACTLPHNQLMIVGGWIANERASKSVEMATIYSQ